MIFRTKAIRGFSALLTFMFVLSSSVFTLVGPVYAASAQVSFTTSSMTITEGESVRVTAVLDRSTLMGVSCPYYTSDGTASASTADYDAASATLYWMTGATKASCTIDTQDDNIVEGNETFYINLGNPTNGDLGSPSMVEVTIVDNDTSPPTTQLPTFSLSSSTYTGSEASKTATITVTKNGAGSASIDYSFTGGTAAAGSDFQNDSNTLRFSSSDTTKVITIAIADDSAVEGSETFNVTLSNPEDANLGTPSSAVVTITDNDTASPGPGTDTGSNPGGTTTTPSINLGASSYSATENQDTVKVAVKKSTTGAAAVVLTTTGSAFTNKAYSEQSTTVSFNSADTSKEVTLYIKDDTAVDGNEICSVTLSNASGAALGSQYSATLTINDNESPSTGGNTPGGGGSGPTSNPPVIGFYSVNKIVGEDANILGIQLEKTGDTASVQYTITGTATPGTDWEGATSGTIDFGTLNSINFKGIKVIEDAIAENNETIVMKLHNPSAGSIDSSKSVITITVVDNDGPPVIKFQDSKYSINESGKSLTITVVKEGSGTASVDYGITSGWADSGSDYYCPDGTLTFAAAETTKTISIDIVDDSEGEGEEWVYMVLRNPSAGATLGIPSTTYVYIVDNDPSLNEDEDEDENVAQVRFSSSEFSCGENVGKFAVTVMREQNTSTKCSIIYETSDGSAAPGLDYNDASGTLTFDVGETTKTFTIDIIDDTIAGEGTETVFMQLVSDSLAEDAAGTLFPFLATLNIIDDDTAAVKPLVPLVEEKKVVDPNKVTTIPGPNGIAESVTSLNIPEDVLGHWGRESILAVMERGVISGYADSTMKPNRAITRAEAAVIIVAALDLKQYTPKKKVVYRDALPSWASKAVMTLTEKGLMGGYADGTFKANKAITRAEICTILMHAFPKTKTQNAKLAFVDRSRIPNWSVQWVAQAVGSGVASGYPNKTFQASRKVSRAETCVMLCKAAGYK